MTPDYALYYRRQISTENIGQELGEFDIFVSAYNPSERVTKVFEHVRAHRKIYLIHPEYGFEHDELPNSCELCSPAERDEIEQVNCLLRSIGPFSGKESICIDITGFMRHVIAFLVVKLANEGIKEFTAIYSEPMSYSKQENTKFSTTTSGVVRPIRGMRGFNRTQMKDYLIIGVGYDHALIGEVLNYKDGATVYPVFSFPSLSPDMYQQSTVRAAQSGDKALEEDWVVNRKFAPANCPFATAAAISEIVSVVDKSAPGSNIYLSPLATKVQALGFAFYWHLEGRAHPALSLILPECVTYARETSEGIKRLWSYTLELDFPAKGDRGN